MTLYKVDLDCRHREGRKTLRQHSARYNPTKESTRTLSQSPNCSVRFGKTKEKNQVVAEEESRKEEIMSDEEIIDCFKLLDPERKGSIKTSELRQIMETFGDKMSSADIDQMIEDAGGGSSIDYVSFVKSMNKKVAKAEQD